MKIKNYPLLIILQGCVLISWLTAELILNIEFFSPVLHYPFYSLGIVFIVTGFAMITLRFSMLFIPLLMALNFVLFIIPRLDKYLTNKYNDEFKKYAGRTKKFIPGIY
jgi:protein-S-isoprenylcysteine O-methyltransferase Ste14